MKKCLLVFCFLLSTNFLNRQQPISWSLVDENCGINEEEIIKDRMESQMADKSKILGKVQNDFINGQNDDYALVVAKRIDDGGYTSLSQLKSDLSSIGYDTDELGINLNDLNL